MITSSDLTERKCRHQETALSDSQIAEYLAALQGWTLDHGKIAKTFSFANYYETLSFINAIAYVFHADDHHPELIVTYNRCVIRFDTHSVNGGRGGLSENDFICAAKVDTIFAQSFS